jgi:hypothetical protein
VSHEDRDELTSWKDIADYLSVNVRTAQRWEQERGLPVRRSGGYRGRVFATIGDLDAWRRSASRKPGWWSSLRVVRAYAVTVTVLLLLGLGVALALFFRVRP